MGSEKLEKYSQEIIERAKKIKLLLLDVDGVLTDGRIIYSSFGEELKNFNVNDGLGIFLLKRARLRCVILTAKASRVVTKRAKELGIDRVYQNHDKNKIFSKIKKKFRVKDEEVCFVGDEIIDIPVLRRAGLSVAPPNAMEVVKEFTHFITEKAGGHGAVREVCELILKTQGLWEVVTASYFK